MQLHAAPLSFGLLFLVFGLANLIDATTEVDVEPKAAWSIALIVMGVAAVTTAIRRTIGRSADPAAIAEDRGTDPDSEPVS